MKATFDLPNGTVAEFPTTGNTVVGCDGTETPSSYAGKHYLYVWNKDLRMHLYYCFEDDLYYPDAPWDKQ
ncbi:hypothetical protein OAL45_00765 [bacterium]|jgi:hypothetical protein|nr:hypothetical protein [bacterium]